MQPAAMQPNQYSQPLAHLSVMPADSKDNDGTANKNDVLYWVFSQH